MRKTRKRKMRTKIIDLCLTLLFIFSSALSAQPKNQQLDSLRKKFTADSLYIFRPRAVFPLFSLDQRNSFIKSQPVNIWGAKAGVTLYDRHNLGFGYYSLETNSSAQRILPDHKENINRSLKMSYATVFYEYNFVESRWWEIGIPVETGYGQYNLVSTNAGNGKVVLNKQGGVIPLGTALDIYFKPTKWFALNLMGGYRWVISDNQKLNLNGWFYSIGGAVYIRQILQDIRFLKSKRAYKRSITAIDESTD